MAEEQQNQGPFSDPNRPAPPAGAPVPPAGVPRSYTSPDQGQPQDQAQSPGQVQPQVQAPGQASGWVQPQDQGAALPESQLPGAAGQNAEFPHAPGRDSWRQDSGEREDQQQGYYQQPDLRQGKDPSGPDYQQSYSVFGPNGRWLWFAGGVLLALIGVIIAVLFNLNKPAHVRNDAVKYAAWGMLLGFVLELVMLYLMGGTEGIYAFFGFGDLASSGGGSVF